ncbi:MAG: hypothetical protein ACSLFE_08015 [Gemmatimonadaceae bacterium]
MRIVAFITQASVIQWGAGQADARPPVLAWSAIAPHTRRIRD